VETPLKLAGPLSLLAEVFFGSEASPSIGVELFTPAAEKQTTLESSVLEARLIEIEVEPSAELAGAVQTSK
jgi:hypothetical protein